MMGSHFYWGFYNTDNRPEQNTTLQYHFTVLISQQHITHYHHLKPLKWEHAPISQTVPLSDGWRFSSIYSALWWSLNEKQILALVEISLRHFRKTLHRQHVFALAEIIPSDGWQLLVRQMLPFASRTLGTKYTAACNTINCPTRCRVCNAIKEITPTRLPFLATGITNSHLQMRLRRVASGTQTLKW